ncbi:MAG: sigma-70 family RNA polymerase sigma factor [Pirellulaceae bacterium]|nr:sigma-70 family RNA polymerase sigma factor [Planctomycetales bacterium]
MSSGANSSRFVDGIRHGDPAAIQVLCDRYYELLANVARQKFGGFPLRVTDEYAVANGVFQEIYERAVRGDLEEIADRQELMALLVRLTKDRVIDEMRRQMADKRGGGRTRGDSVFVSPQHDGGHAGFDNFRATIDSPSAREIVRENLKQILDRLPDETCRSVLLLRCEGYTNADIADLLDVSVATVERKRRRIRDVMADLASNPSADS